MLGTRTRCGLLDLRLVSHTPSALFSSPPPMIPKIKGLKAQYEGTLATARAAAASELKQREAQLRADAQV